MTSSTNAGSYLLLYQDAPEVAPKLGDRVSRPAPNDVVRNYRLTIRFADARPMVVGLNARTKREAIQFAKNRWPKARSIEAD
jgi:hypothetical protein